jgi:hypothetical protein
MKHVFRLILLTSCLLLLSTFLFANDPAQEFSITNNPNGVWSYGLTWTLGGPFELYTTGTPNAPDAPSGDIWNLGGVTCNNSCVSRSQQQEINATGVDVVFPFDTLHMHPGSAGQYAIVRWTAPLAGLYEVRGSFQGSQRAGPTTDVHVQWDSATVLFRGNINGFGDVALFDAQHQVTAGDTIDFAVGFGIDGSYYADSTALQARIDLVPAIKINPCDPSSEIHKTPGTIAVAILSTASFDAPALLDRDSLTFGRIGNEHSLVGNHGRRDSRMDDSASCTSDNDANERKSHEQSLVSKLDRWDHREGDLACSMLDVNGDGRKDLVCLFDRELAGFQLTDTSAVLRGKTVTGITIKGTAPVHIVE